MTGPGAEAVASCVERFFACAEVGDWDGMLALTADDMTAWQSGGNPRGLFREAVAGFGALRERMGAWEYLDVQRVVGEDAFCEQHTVRFSRLDGSTREFSACVVGRLGPNGLLISLDEYLDPARESTWQS